MPDKGTYNGLLLSGLMIDSADSRTEFARFTGEIIFDGSRKGEDLCGTKSARVVPDIKSVHLPRTRTAVAFPFLIELRLEFLEALISSQ